MADRIFPVTEKKMVRDRNCLLSNGLKANDHVGRGSHSPKYCTCHTHAGTNTQRAQKFITTNEECKIQPIMTLFQNLCSKLARRIIKVYFLP